MSDQDPLKKLYGRSFSDAHTIFREGEQGNRFYLIHSGQVRIVKDLGGPDEMELTTFGPGDFFGEMALFDMETRSATAICVGPVEVYELGQRNFESFVTQKPRVAMDIIQKLCGRIRHTNEMARKGKAAEAAGATGATGAAEVPSAASPGFFELAVQLLLLLAVDGAQAAGEKVVIRPHLDLGRLGEIYGMDLSGLQSFFAQETRTRTAMEFLTREVHADDAATALIGEVLEKTLVEIDLGEPS